VCISAWGPEAAQAGSLRYINEMSRRRFMASALSAAVVAALPARPAADRNASGVGVDHNDEAASSNLEISASDWLRPEETRIRGNTVCLYLSGGTREELKALFERLSEAAEVTDPLTEMFFGMYGALNDKFGVRWMFQANKKA